MADFQTDLEKSLINIEAVFNPGRLGDKRREMLQLQESGDTMLFLGEVRWSVFLPDDDKKLKGESETLDDAFGDMSLCLGLLANDHAEDTQVICAIEPAGENGGKKS